MVLMAMLATLAIGFLPNAASSARESRAGLKLQSWLNIAKQRAVRDQAPRGLRLNLATSGVAVGNATIFNAVTDCQYLEVPGDFPTTVGSTVNRAPNPPGQPLVAPFNTSNTLQIGGVDLLNGYTTSAADLPYWSVQPGDSIELLGSGLMYRITQVGVPVYTSVTPPVKFVQGSYVAIDPPLPAWVLPSIATANYRIVRRARPVGDEALKMPDGTLIDIGTNASFGNPLPPGLSPPYYDINGNPLPASTLAPVKYDVMGNPLPASAAATYYDILFAPTGAVISPGLATTKIHLWVRAPNPDDGASGTNVFRGDPTLISIFVRTGFVGAYSPAQPPNNPYVLVQ